MGFFLVSAIVAPGPGTVCSVWQLLHDTSFFVPAGGPEGQVPVAAGGTTCKPRLSFGGDLFVVESEDAGHASSAAGFGVLQRIGMTRLAIGPFQIALLAVLGG